MFAYLLAPNQLQALDLGRHMDFVVVEGYQTAPPALWVQENPRGRVQRFFSGLKLARISGIDTTKSMIHGTDSMHYEELRDRCAQWVEHFSKKDTILGLEGDFVQGPLPWFNLAPNASYPHILVTSAWTLRSIFPKADDDLLMEYEGLPTGRSKAISFDFKPPGSAQLSFPF